jgi:DNA-binding LytR/AlgR family response regulator
MTCIIIEDQAPAQRILAKFINDAGTINLKGTFSNAVEALHFLNENKVDLLFLDVHLPKISGIDFLRALPYKPSVIFTTAFSDYAVQSYEFDAIDYLIKPFSFERFLKAVAKVNDTKPSLEKKSLSADEFYIKSGHDLIKISISEVKFIKADMDYTEVHLNDKKYISNIRLSSWEEQFAHFDFIRIHKSYLINSKQILKISGKQVFLNEDTYIPIGRAYKETFLAKVLHSKK